LDDRQLLSYVGSWGDTQDDKDILELLVKLNDAAEQTRPM
jgi:hypothetical protein